MIHFASSLKPKRGRRRQVAAARAVAYVRVSTDEQANGPDAQRHAIEAYAAAHGITVARWCEDIGVSGAAAIDERPALLAALEALKAERAGVLLVAKRDRLARDAMASAMLERLVQHESASIVAADGTGNGSGPEAEMLRGMIDLFAQYERALIRLRTRAALAAKQRRGERTGGIPYGKRVAADGVQLEDDPAEAKVVKRIRRAREAGRTLLGIVEMLNVERVPARGSRWHLATVQRILARC